MIVAANRHPRGLHVLFLTEMWERFSYYGMRALLVYLQHTTGKLCLLPIGLSMLPTSPSHGWLR